MHPGLLPTSALMLARRTCCEHPATAGRTLGEGADSEHSRTSALMLAAQAGREPALRLMLRAPVAHPAGERDSAGRTALILAAMRGHAGAVALLCGQPGADGDACDSAGWTAAMHAAHAGHDAALRVLGARARALLHGRDATGASALLLAAAAGRCSTVAMLLDGDYALDVEVCDNKQRTAVMCAARRGQAAAVRALVAQHGARVDRLDSKGCSLLMLAAGGSGGPAAASASVGFLLALGGARLAQRDLRGRTALMLAAKAGNDLAFAQLLPPRDGGAMMRDAARMLSDASAPAGVRVLLPLPNVVNLTDERGWTALMFAAHKGRVAAAQSLALEHGADVEAVSDLGWTAFLLAVSQGHADAVLALGVACGADTGRRLCGKWPPLVLAASGGFTATLLALIGPCNLDPNAPCVDGWTPLMMAVLGAHAGTAEALCALPKVDVDAQNRDGVSALMLAADQGHTRLALLLAQQRGARTELCSASDRTALMAAAINGHTATVLALVAQGGADVDFANRREWTALAFAVRFRRTATVRALLVQCGACAHARGFGAMCSPGFPGLLAPAMLAAEGGHLGSLALLLGPEGGVDVNRRDDGGFTLLMCAAAKGHTRALDFLLARCGALPDYVDGQSRSALMWACMHGQGAAAQMLAARGAALETRDRYGWTGFAVACIKSHAQLAVALATQHGARVDVADWQGWTPLMHAVSHANLQLALLLLDRCGADAALADPTGLSVLMLAAMHSQPALAAVLVCERGAPVDAVNADGRSALMFAAIHSGEETVAELLRLGADARLRDARGATALSFSLGRHKRTSALLRAAAARAAQALALAFALCLGPRQDGAAPCAALHADLVAAVVARFRAGEAAAARMDAP